MNLKIEYIDISELQPYSRNAKIHTEEQIEQIKRSVEQFGMNDPIAVWKNNEIIEGHGRLEAAKELGFDTVPIIRLDHLTDEERRAYMLVHNKLTMNTGFDFMLLESELNELCEAVDFEAFGFDINIPEAFDESLLSQYDQLGDELLKSKRVIINYDDEQEDALKRLLGIDEDDKLRVTYKASEILKD